MSSVNQQAGPGTIRRHLVSLSSVFRSQASKRARIPDPVQEEPTCQERIHYPVFNPLDPRHNPEISALSWSPQEQRGSSSDSRSPMAWIQSISRRSLHRARSGLSALRSGFSRRSSEEEKPETGFVSPVALRQERQRRGISSGAYTSDTQEDVNFGAELSRMDLRPSLSSPASSTTEVESLIHVSSTNSMDSLIRRVSSLNSLHDTFETVPADTSTPTFYPPTRAVSNSGLNSTCTLATDHDLDFQFGGTGELEANMDSEDHFTHTTPLTENHLMQQTWGIAISTDKEIKMPAHELADPWPVREEQQATHLQQENISQASSDTQISDDQPNSVPISRQSSAEVRFAFPGIYHETLRQWTSQHGSPSPSQHTPNFSEQSPNTSQHSLNLSQHSPILSQHSPIISQHSPILSQHSPILSQHSPILSQHSPILSQHSPILSQHSPGLHGQEETSCDSRNPLECIGLPDDPYSNLPPYDEYNEGLIPLVPPQTPITQSEEMQPISYPNPLTNPLNCISTRNFGERWSSISERATTQRSSVEDHSSRYTPAGTTSRDMTSTEMTSMESMSNNTWSPWSPADSELLFPSPVEDGNGYFLVDGKTSSQYPDRGNQPVKSAQHTTNNCGNTRAPQELTQLVSPGIMSLPLISDGIPGAGFDFVEEDTDDEFYPGIVQPRQFW